MSEKTQEQAKSHAFEIITDALAQLEPHFKPEVKLTLIDRFPGDPNGDILVTADLVSEVAALIDRRKLCDCGHHAYDHGFVGDHIRSECAECSCVRFQDSEESALRRSRAARRSRGEAGAGAGAAG